MARLEVGQQFTNKDGKPLLEVVEIVGTDVTLKVLSREIAPFATAVLTDSLDRSFQGFGLTLRAVITDAETGIIVKMSLPVEGKVTKEVTE